MTALVKTSPAAGLLDQPGVGPVTAAIAFAAWSHPGRVRSEAAFASLARSIRSPPRPATPFATGSTAVVTDASIAPYTWLWSPACAGPQHACLHREAHRREAYPPRDSTVPQGIWFCLLYVPAATRFDL